MAIPPQSPQKLRRAQSDVLHPDTLAPFYLYTPSPQPNSPLHRSPQLPNTPFQISHKQSSISLLLLLPILIMRLVVERTILHEQHICIVSLLPTIRQTSAVANTNSHTFCCVWVSPQKQRMTVLTSTTISMLCEVEKPYITTNPIDSIINQPEFITPYISSYNHHQRMNKLDAQKLAEDKKLAKELQPGQTIVLSAKLVKINHVNKKQERIILLTNKNLYNILPSDTFLGLFSRIKRRIPYSNIIAMTVSRFGSQFVVHVEKEHDYRFSSPNLKLKIVETLVECYCNFHKKKMALYYYDDLSLEHYTTTINDVDKNKKKVHTIDPLYLDSESIKQNEQVKAESKLIFKNESNVDNISTFEEFQLLKVLGRGAFGKVMLCQNKKNNKYYAIKSMRKQDLIEKEHLTKTKTQRYLLEKSKHPFLVSLEFAFQTKQKIFFVMDFIRGGEMFTHLRKCKKFTEKRAKFYAAQVFLAVQYLHDLGFVYRDLKPQNILFQTDGYLKVSDYGLAKQLKPGEKTYSLAGTPDYVSPQIITSKGQTFMTDWWALGILIYEMVYGSPPFYNRDHEKMFQDIVNRELFFDNAKTDISDHCKNLIYSLLKKDPAKRIGAKDENEIKNHPWFADINWSMLLAKKIKPDFIPVVGTEIDVTNFDETFTKQQPINSLVSTDMLLLSKFEKEFAGIDFYGEEKKEEETTPGGSSGSQQPNFGKKKQ